MNYKDITSAKYSKYLSENCSITVVADGVTMRVPLDTANTDYQAILELSLIHI